MPGRAFSSRRMVHPQAFSFIELLAGLTLLGIVALAFYTIQSTSQRFPIRGEKPPDLHENGRAALQLVTSELQGASRIVSTDPNEVILVSDRFVPGQERRLYLDTGDADGDGITSELVLSRSPGDDGSAGPVVDEVAQGICSLSVCCLGSGTTGERRDEVREAVSVRRVEVTLEAETAPAGTDGRRTLRFSSRVRSGDPGLLAENPSNRADPATGTPTW